MFKNYLKTALRNLLRYKGFSLINIASLTLGIIGCLVIGLFVWDEWQYDKFIKDGNNIYRLYLDRSGNSSSNPQASTPPAFGAYAQENFPEVEGLTRMLMWNGKMLMERGQINEFQNGGVIADSTFFNMFPLPFEKGDRNSALMHPNAVVLSHDLAKKYFGDSDPLDQPIKLEKADFIVKGVLAPLPEHFHLKFNYVLPLAAGGIPTERMSSWGWNQFYTYLKLKPGSDPQKLQAKLQQAVIKHASEDPDETGEPSLPVFQSLSEIHLGSANFEYDNASRGNGSYVKGLSIIAAFVLLIACFNFINLATARSFRRAKEIGVRKVVGAKRKQLVFQFIGETILLSFISIIVAVIGTILLLPALNNFTGKSISFNPFLNPLLSLSLLALAFIIGILSGIYPALVMSGFQPIKVLKGLKPTGNHSNSPATLRQGLVIVQFALSALLIICTMVVYRQLNYLNHKDLGFNKDQILYFGTRGDIQKNFETFKAELKRSPGVVSVTGGYGLPGDQLATDGIIVPGKNNGKEFTAIQLLVDADYVKTMGLQLIAGRDFSKEFSTDVQKAFIINEAAVKELGFGTPQAALGQALHWNKWEPDSLNPIKKGEIVGVVKDFHVKSLHEKISTTVMQIYPEVLVKMAVKVKAENLPATIEHIKKTWSSFAPGYPLDYNFLDENFEAMYTSEKKLGSLLWIFTLMAIFIGCMGLFGLAAFSAEQRIKEIGIRKVLGASVLNITAMLSKTFLKPVFISSLLAFPVAWWMLNNWLENFTYRISISWWVFAIATIAALVIAFITVGYQAVKAARSNPVKSLRTE
jgi:putative ABC transport system permease protein